VQEVKELHLEDMDVIVEPGIGWIELNEYLKPHGLFFPLDPGNTSLLCGLALSSHLLTANIPGEMET
jgi:D-lactate dehydrogenase (cytochrome)